jgi:hypothetical protein
MESCKQGVATDILQDQAMADILVKEPVRAADATHPGSWTSTDSLHVQRGMAWINSKIRNFVLDRALNLGCEPGSSSPKGLCEDDLPGSFCRSSRVRLARSPCASS